MVDAEPDSTSWNLIADAAAGRLVAREAFAHRYEAGIRTQLAQRWPGGELRQHLEDAVQEVFVECLKPGGVLQRADPAVPEGFRALLGAVVRNVALRFETRMARQRRREDAAPSRLEQVPGDQTSLAATLDREWARGVLRAAVEEQETLAVRSGPAAVLRLKLLQEVFRSGRGIGEIARDWEQDAAWLHHQYAKARRDFLRALLRTLARRFPRASGAELRALCRRLTELDG